jgi:uncharacterized NAD-dependent epimerase/dehydratase family protein
VKLLSLGTIMIAGVIDTTGIDLAREAPGQGLISGSISTDTFSLMAPLTGAITYVQ